MPEVDTVQTQPDSPPTQNGGLGVTIGGPVVTEEPPSEPSILDDDFVYEPPTEDESEAPESADEESTGETPEEEPVEEEPLDDDGLPDGWEANERVKTFVEEARREEQSKAQRAMQRAVEDAEINAQRLTVEMLQGIHDSELQEAQRIGTTSAIVDNFKEQLSAALEDPDMNRAVSQVLARHTGWVEAYNNGQVTAAHEQMLNQLLNSRVFVVGLDADAMRRLRGEASRADLELRGKRLTAFEIQERLIAARDRVRDPIMRKSYLAAEQERINGLAKKQARASDSNANRQANRAAVPSGGTGGGSRAALKRKIDDGSANVRELKEAEKLGLLDY